MFMSESETHVEESGVEKKLLWIQVTRMQQVVSVDTGMTSRLDLQWTVSSAKYSEFRSQCMQFVTGRADSKGRASDSATWMRAHCVNLRVKDYKL